MSCVGGIARLRVERGSRSDPLRLPPASGSVYRSPSSSNTTVCPSGDTSSDIQVPSDVMKSTARVGFKGSESGPGRKGAVTG